MGFKDNFKAARAARLLHQSGQTLEKAGLDTDNYTDEQIRALNTKNIQKIRQDLAGNGLIKVGLLVGGSTVERATLGYLSALVEQNWVLMRQNELLVNALNKLAERDNPS